MKQNNKISIDKSFNAKEKKQNKGRGIFTLIVSLIAIIVLLYLFLTRSGDIVGSVIDSTDKNTTLSGVNIKLDDDKPIENNNLTGSFLLQSIKPGKHKLTINKSGYKKYEEEINLNPGATFKLEVKLVPNLQNIVPDNNAFKLSKFNLAAINNDSVTVIDPINNQKPSILASGNKPWDIITVPEHGKIYVSNFGDSNVSIIDLKGFKIIKQIKFDSNAQVTKLNISLDKDKVYVLNLGLNKISSINTTTDELNPDEIKSDLPLVGFVVDNMGNLLLINNSNLVIATKSGNVVRTINLKSSFSYNKFAYSKENNTVLLIPFTKNLVSYNLSNDNESSIELKGNVVNALFSQLGDKIYVLSSSSLSILETNTMKFLKEDIPINVTDANNMTISPDGQKIFITSGSGISIFDCNKESMSSEHLDLSGSVSSITAWANL